MAIARLGPIVTAASGTVGGIVIANTAAGAVLKTRPIQTPSNSEAALTARAAFRAAQNAWDVLGTEDRAAWRAFASRIADTNRLGSSRAPSAREVYVRNNTRNIFCGGAAIDTAPTELSPAFPKLLSASMTVGVSYTVVFSATSISHLIIIKAQRGMATTHSKRSPWKTVLHQTTGGPTPPTFNLRTAWLPLLGELVVGEHFALRCSWTSNLQANWGKNTYYEGVAV